ncbi:MAG: BamA/TamA family outer membrane protein [Saprospiraceae bacterium]|nr:BamA/TamA family outer membrane protein [Saprospiraceae bacterium]
MAIAILASLVLSSCMSTWLLPKGERLYKGAKIRLKPAGKHWKTAELEAALEKDIVLPRRSKSFLGMRPRVGIYNIFHNRKKEKGFRNWVAKSFGKQPVLNNTGIITQHQTRMKNTAAAHGFFSVRVVTKVKGFWKKKKLRHKVYLLQPAKRIHQLNYPADSTELGRRLSQLQASSLLKLGKPYSFEKLGLERQRLTDSLRNEGWFYLSPENLIFKADTLNSDSLVNIRLEFKDDVTDREKRRYRISEIVIYPDHDPQTAGEMGQQREAVDSCTAFVFSEMPLKKRVILDNLRFGCGEYFSNEKYRSTLFRLLNLGFYKFVNIRYEQSGLADSLLEAHVYLTPQVPKKLEASVSGIFSNNYYGAQSGLSWLHRNLFGAAENLRIGWEGNWVQYDKSQSIFTSDIKASLTLPQRIPGFKMRQKNALTATRVSFLHQLYFYQEPFGSDTVLNISIHNFEGEGGFYWKKNKQGTITHELNPINASLQFTHFNLDSLKEFILLAVPFDTSAFLLQFVTQVKLKPSYAFVFDNRSLGTPKWPTVFRQRFVLNGSGFLLPKDIANAADLGYPLNFFTETDFRQYLKLQRKTTLAYRLAFSSAFVLSEQSGFTPLDLYTIGGPSSVRAFRPRYIGPGTRLPDDLIVTDGDNLVVNNHIGNLMLLGSVELRQQLGKNWELAAFYDAGNIWFTKSAGGTEEEQFTSDFYNELASGAGLGIRYNLSLFILRLDLAIPISKPYQPLGSRWIGQPDYGSFAPQFNFAFGHPF